MKSASFLSAFGVYLPIFRSPRLYSNRFITNFLVLSDITDNHQPIPGLDICDANASPVRREMGQVGNANGPPWTPWIAVWTLASVTQVRRARVGVVCSIGVIRYDADCIFPWRRVFPGLWCDCIGWYWIFMLSGPCPSEIHSVCVLMRVSCGIWDMWSTIALLPLDSLLW